MPSFEFATAARIVFGDGCRRGIPSILAGLSPRLYLVTGRDPARHQEIVEGCRQAGCGIVGGWRVEGEPTVGEAARAGADARGAGAGVVLAIGGGSVLDMGKAVAALAVNGGEILDYLEVIGAGRPLEQPALPCVAVPTTAGTGSEVTRNAVLGSPEHGVKVSLRSAHMLPRAAVVDPELTHGLPPRLTAWTGMDALTQLIEAFVSARANPLVDGICREGIGRAARSLETAFLEGFSPAAREDMALAGLFGGLALANAGLGAVHGFAGPLGGMLGAPHGALCARLLAPVMEANLAAARVAGAGETVRRYGEVARLLTGRAEASPEEGIARAAELTTALKIERLGDWGLSGGRIGEAVAKARRASSMKGNPMELAEDALGEILRKAL